jgi:thiol:disulfide interchange protein DsbD
MVMLLVLLMVAVAAWIYGRWGSVAAATATRRFGSAAALAVLAASLIGGSAGLSAVALAPTSKGDSSGDGIVWQVYSRDRVAQARAEGRPVFIDFTAAWCLSCQVNERVALASEDVRRRFRQLGIVPLKADWTNRSEEITRGLAAYNRNSVPLYVLYAPGASEPLLLPEILTPGIVLDALQTMETSLVHSNATRTERIMP